MFALLQSSPIDASDIHSALFSSEVPLPSVRALEDPVPQIGGPVLLSRWHRSASFVGYRNSLDRSTYAFIRFCSLPAGEYFRFRRFAMAKT